MLKWLSEGTSRQRIHNTRFVGRARAREPGVRRCFDIMDLYQLIFKTQTINFHSVFFKFFCSLLPDHELRSSVISVCINSSASETSFRNVTWTLEQKTSSWNTNLLNSELSSISLKSLWDVHSCWPWPGRLNERTAYSLETVYDSRVEISNVLTYRLRPSVFLASRGRWQR